MQDSIDFTNFYEASFQKVLNACFIWCGDPELARDATQEAFTRAYVRWSRLRGEPWMEGWVIVTATNWLRRYRLRRHREKQSQLAPEHIPPHLNSDLVEAVRDLPKRQRQAILLYYFADYPVATVAQLMDVSVGAVKSHLSRGRLALRDRIGNDGRWAREEVSNVEAG